MYFQGSREQVPAHEAVGICALVILGAVEIQVNGPMQLSLRIEVNLKWNLQIPQVEVICPCKRNNVWEGHPENYEDHCSLFRGDGVVIIRSEVF